MKMLIYIVLLLAFVSCKNANNNNISGSILYTLTDKRLNYEYIQSKINEFESNSGQQGCDLKTIQKQILSYKHIGIGSIPITEHIIKRCIGYLNESDKDSVYLLFYNVFYNTANALTDSLETEYSGVIKKIKKDVNDSETKNFKKCLDICGLTLLMTEGTYYVDAQSEYFYGLFKNKVSPALDDFLKIRSKELKQGFSEDAGLLISFDDLYGRVINWGNFMAKYPNFFMKDLAQNYYDVYLSTFLSGMDNSRPFDMESEILLPDMKRLYEKIIGRNESKKSSIIISEFYDLLKTTDFRQPDNLEKFLKDRGLYTC